MPGQSLVKASRALAIPSSDRGGEGGPNPGRDSGGGYGTVVGSYAGEVGFLSALALAFAALRSRWFLGWFFLTITGRTVLTVIGVRVDWLTWGGGVALALVLIGGFQALLADREQARIQRHRMAVQRAESARRVERVAELEQLRQLAAAAAADRRRVDPMKVEVTISDLPAGESYEYHIRRLQELRWQRARRDAGYGPNDEIEPDPLLALIQAETTPLAFR